jgi:MFS family permease
MNKNLKILSLAFFFIFFGFNGIQQYVTAFFSDIGHAQMGFIVLILIYFFFALSNPLAAYCISKFGLKKCIAIGSFFYFLFLFSLQLKSSLIIYFAAILIGMAASFLWTGTNCYLVKASDKESYGKASGYFFAILALGSALGVIIMGFLVNKFQFQLPFLLFSFFPLIGLVLILTLKDFRSEPQTNRLKSLTKVMTNKMALEVSSICFAFSLIQGIQFGILPLEIRSITGVQYMGILLAFFFIFPIFSSYYLGKLSDRLGRKKMVLSSYLIAIAGLLFLYYSNGFNAVTAGIVLLALFYAMMQPSLICFGGRRVFIGKSRVCCRVILDDANNRDSFCFNCFSDMADEAGLFRGDRGDVVVAFVPEAVFQA